uniref:BHLH domain-containing protein n=1 Tax=Trichuris muris TaxID=70415 RepID=A0A5S6R2R9_TRIMR
MAEMAYENGVSRSGNRSTRGASKQRRALINQEIDQLKLQLPIPTVTKQRLFQLQIMALTCAHVRKYWFTNTVLPKAYSSCLDTVGVNKSPFCYAQKCDEENLFERALRNFIVLVNQYGKVIYLAGNVTETLGRNTVDIIAHADNVYDWIDGRDHGCMQMALTSTRNSNFGPTELGQVLVCRLQPLTSGKRSAQEQSLIVHCRQFHAECTIPTEPELSERQKRIQPVFALDCRVLLNAENIENTYFGSSDVFHSLHEMNMRIISADNGILNHMGVSAEELSGVSWFSLLHPLDVAEAAFKHRLLCDGSEQYCCCLLCFVTGTGGHLWAHCVLIVKQKQRTGDQRQITCGYQLVDETEAAILRSKDYLYSTHNIYLDGLVCYPAQSMMHQFNNSIFMDAELYTPETYQGNFMCSSQQAQCIEPIGKADERYNEHELCDSTTNCNTNDARTSLLLQSGAAYYYY